MSDTSFEERLWDRSFGWERFDQKADVPLALVVHSYFTVFFMAVSPAR